MKLIGKARLVRKALVLSFSLSLLLSSVGIGSTSAAVPSLPWLSGYTGTTQGDESQLTAFENWRGKRVDITQAYIGGTYKATWTGMTNNPPALTANGTIATVYSNNRLVTFGVPLLAEESEGDFAGLADGDYDSYHQTIANTIHNLVGNNTIYIRLGWEANRGYAWSYEDHGGLSIASQYKTGWARIASIYKNTVPGAKLVWNNLRTITLPITSFYPGNDAVDILSMDPYDNGSSGYFADSSANWNTFLGSYNSSTGMLSGPGGLLAYAKTLGKKIAIDEWGPTNKSGLATDGSNNSYYVNAFYNWFKANAADIEYEAFFGGAAPLHQIYPRVTALGNASDSYLAAYSQPIEDTQAPTVPTGLVSTSKNQTSVDLSWTASSDNVGVTNYNVLRNGVYVGSTGGATTYTDTGLTPGTSYSYTVKARDAAGNYSAPSGALSVTTVPSTSVVAPKTAVPLNINGNLLDDAGWDVSSGVAKTILGTPNNTVTFGVQWDETYLYVGIKALDGTLKNDSTAKKDDDTFDIYIDADHNKGTVYDSHDRQFTVGWNDTTLFERNGNTAGVQFATAAVTGGFSSELAIPWSNLGVTPAVGLTIGLDIANNDDDDGGARDSQLIWRGTADDWTDTSNFGDAVLSAH